MYLSNVLYGLLAATLAFSAPTPEAGPELQPEPELGLKKRASPGKRSTELCPEAFVKFFQLLEPTTMSYAVPHSFRLLHTQLAKDRLSTLPSRDKSTICSQTPK